jgi:hypothetical protein
MICRYKTTKDERRLARDLMRRFLVGVFNFLAFLLLMTLVMVSIAKYPAAWVCFGIIAGSVILLVIVWMCFAPVEEDLK